MNHNPDTDVTWVYVHTTPAQIEHAPTTNHDLTLETPLEPDTTTPHNAAHRLTTTDSTTPNFYLPPAAVTELTAFIVTITTKTTDHHTTITTPSPNHPDAETTLIALPQSPSDYIITLDTTLDHSLTIALTTIELKTLHSTLAQDSSRTTPSTN